MAFNPFKKKDDFVDLSAHFKKQQDLAKKREEESIAEAGDLKKNFYPGIGFNKSAETTQTESAPEAEEPAAPVFGIFNQDNNT